MTRGKGVLTSTEGAALLGLISSKIKRCAWVEHNGQNDQAKDMAKQSRKKFKAILRKLKSTV